MSADGPLPAYEYPRRDLALFGLNLLTGRPRPFARDGALLLRTNPHPRRVEGLEHVPREGAYVLVMNHFSRPGLRPYHCAMMLTRWIEETGAPADIRWAFTSEYRGRRIGPVPVPLALIRWVFRRVAKVYGFVIIPRRQEMVAGRAAALRRLVRLLDRGHAIGMTPEGDASGATGPLVVPPEGSGRFLLALTRGQTPLLPVGLFEEDGVFVARFGEPFRLKAPPGTSPAEQDAWARTEVMARIGALLPPSYHGAYAEEIERRSREAAR
ncbi:MAG TPA: hypothetical protein VNM91_11080 [Dehalococcoidia bacterium]|nr:hypothetical protein [Dehalococcoidia bacterium]